MLFPVDTDAAEAATAGFTPMPRLSGLRGFARATVNPGDEDDEDDDDPKRGNIEPDDDDGAADDEEDDDDEEPLWAAST